MPDTINLPIMHLKNILWKLKAHIHFLDCGKEFINYTASTNCKYINILFIIFVY